MDIERVLPPSELHLIDRTIRNYKENKIKPVIKQVAMETNITTK